MKLLKKILFPHSYSSEAFVNYLRNKKVNVGKGTYIFSPNHVIIDVERPHMLSIGNYCKISSGVKILTHDYSKSVLCNLPYGDVGEAGFTSIGDNCFIGANAVILMGCQIGDNCIVGAGSICTGKYPSNSVIAGNPARVICSIEEYFKKKKDKELDSAKEYVKKFRKVFNRDPSIEEMTNTFLWLYTPRNEENLKRYSNLFKHNGIDEKHYIDSFMKTNPIYPSFEEFLRDCDRS